MSKAALEQHVSGKHEKSTFEVGAAFVTNDHLMQGMMPAAYSFFTFFLAALALILCQVHQDLSQMDD